MTQEQLIYTAVDYKIAIDAIVQALLTNTTALQIVQCAQLLSFNK
jgi:hypothetical protein